MKFKARQYLRPAFSASSQIAFFVLVWVAADFLGHKFGCRMPASVTGMIAVLILLFSGVLKPHFLRAGAHRLHAEMLLFFVPAVVAIMNYAGLLAAQGLRLVGAIGLGTALVMAGTAWLVDKVFRWESQQAAAPTPDSEG
jgi:holin-like protein